MGTTSALTNVFNTDTGVKPVTVSPAQLVPSSMVLMPLKNYVNVVVKTFKLAKLSAIPNVVLRVPRQSSPTTCVLELLQALLFHARTHTLHLPAPGNMLRKSTSTTTNVVAAH